MAIVCRNCGKTIPSEDVNVLTDVAFCRKCNTVNRLSDLSFGLAINKNVDVNNPPPGAWFRREGTATGMGATARSLGAALGLLLVSLFWNGIVSVFVLLAISSTLSLVHIPMPDWFPAPKMNHSSMGVGMTLFLWIFLSPFIAIGVAMILGLLSSLGGKCEVWVDGSQGVVFTGLGAVGFRKRFQIAEVKEIRVEQSQWNNTDGNRQKKANITIENKSGKKVKFGSMLTPERRSFLAAALRREVLK
jgi:hypothetical protein